MLKTKYVENSHKLEKTEEPETREEPEKNETEKPAKTRKNQKKKKNQGNWARPITVHRCERSGLPPAERDK